MAIEKKPLARWLNEAGRDQEVLGLFWAGRLDEAVNLAAARYGGDDDQKHLLKENDPEKIGKKLKQEAAEYEVQETDAAGMHTYWVLVRV